MKHISRGIMCSKQLPWEALRVRMGEKHLEVMNVWNYRIMKNVKEKFFLYEM